MSYATASSFCSVRPTPAPSYLGIHRSVHAQHPSTNPSRSRWSVPCMAGWQVGRQPDRSPLLCDPPPVSHRALGAPGL